MPGTKGPTKLDVTLWITAVVVIVLVGVAVIFGVIYSGSAATRAASAGQPYIPVPTPTYTAAQGVITVGATGTAYATPMQSELSVYVNGTGATTQAATQSLSAALASFNSTVMPYINNNQSNIQTTGYTLTKVYNQSRYLAQESIQLTIPNIRNTSAALGALSAITNVYVSGATPQLSPLQVSSLRTLAITMAMANATGEASTVAGPGASLTQGNVTLSSYYYPYFSFGSLAPAGAAASPAFYSGRSGVTVSVTAQFAYTK